MVVWVDEEMRRVYVWDGEGKGSERKLCPYIPQWEVMENAYIKIRISNISKYIIKKLWKQTPKTPINQSNETRSLKMLNVVAFGVVRNAPRGGTRDHYFSHQTL